MCASNNKEMYTIREMARKADEKAFVIIMESNEVLWRRNSIVEESAGGDGV